MSVRDNTAALVVEKLVKRFGDITAVDGISLRIEAGQVYGVLGPNGAGKSTAIKMIAGLLHPDSGSIKIFGRNLSPGSSVLEIGLCPQELVIWEGLTLMEQLLFIAGMYNIPSHIAGKRAIDLLNSMHLTDRKNKLASALSGGMKRRLNILLALIHDPKILILDEPQAGLDPQSRVLVREYIKSIASKKTIVITTHDMEEADKIADRVAIIDRGRILVEDTPANLKKDMFKGDIVEFALNADMMTPNVEMSSRWESILKRKYHSASIQDNILQVIAEKPFAAVREIEELLNADKVRIDDVKIRKGTLEDVFISLTGRGLRE